MDASSCVTICVELVLYNNYHATYFRYKFVAGAIWPVYWCISNAGIEINPIFVFERCVEHTSRVFAIFLIVVRW